MASMTHFNPIRHVGHDAPPPKKKMFLTSVLKRVGGGSWHLVTFNIYGASEKVIFGSLGYPVLP